MKGRTSASGDSGKTPDWDTVMPKYRERWKERKVGGRRWDDVEPAYRVGWDVARRGRERYPDKPWDRFLDAAQDAWDDLTAEPGSSPHAGEVGARDESSGR